MKRFIKLCIALMLIAGAAGAVDFVKMYRTGEIQKIYEQKERALVTPKTVTVSPVIKQEPPAITAHASVKKQKPESETLPVPVSEHIGDDPNELPKSIDHASVMQNAAVEEPETPSVITPRAAKYPKKKLSLRMYLRAAEVEEPLEMDSVAVSLIDTAAVKAVNP